MMQSIKFSYHVTIKKCGYTCRLVTLILPNFLVYKKNWNSLKNFPFSVYLFRPNCTEEDNLMSNFMTNKNVN